MWDEFIISARSWRRSVDDRLIVVMCCYHIFYLLWLYPSCNPGPECLGVSLDPIYVVGMIWTLLYLIMCLIGVSLLSGYGLILLCFIINLFMFDFYCILFIYFMISGMILYMTYFICGYICVLYILIFSIRLRRPISRVS